jgi:HEPN domain-containing protein
MINFTVEGNFLTKKEHIAYWVDTANRDWRTVQDLYKCKNYLSALFFAHLVLEKLCKAHWVKDNTENTPPKIHNIIVLIENTKFEITDEDKDFFRAMNQFQLEGRYPDYKNMLYKIYKGLKTKKILDKVNTVRKCLLKNL